MARSVGTRRLEGPMRIPLSEENQGRTGRKEMGLCKKIWGTTDRSLGEPASGAGTRAPTSKGAHGGLGPGI